MMVGGASNLFMARPVPVLNNTSSLHHSGSIVFVLFNLSLHRSKIAGSRCAISRSDGQRQRPWPESGGDGAQISLSPPFALALCHLAARRPQPSQSCSSSILLILEVALHVSCRQFCAYHRRLSMLFGGSDEAYGHQ
jgi:hypothetical protein